MWQNCERSVGKRPRTVTVPVYECQAFAETEFKVTTEL